MGFWGTVFGQGLLHISFPRFAFRFYFYFLHVLISLRVLLPSCARFAHFFPPLPPHLARFFSLHISLHRFTSRIPHLAIPSPDFPVPSPSLLLPPVLITLLLLRPSVFSLSLISLTIYLPLIIPIFLLHPPLLLHTPSSFTLCLPPPFHPCPLVPSTSDLNLKLILTHCSFLGPINRKSNESCRTWRFVQADRG